MSQLKKSKLISQISIAAQIVDGSIKIDSIEEFDNILKLFPDDPELQRVYSDLLIKKKMSEDAARSYGKAANRFIDSGMMLQAIVSKSLQWKITPPADLNEARYFFSELKKGSYHESPLNTFFNELSYPAMLAILYSFVKIRLPAGKIVKKNGEGEKDLFLIVSGALRETTFQPVKADQETLYKKHTFNLSENDFFGNVYPFEEEKLSQSYIEAITEVELVKISKANLKKICRKYADVENGIINLYKARSGNEPKNIQSKERKGERHHTPVKLNLQINADPSGNTPLLLDGYSRDISIGGICVVLDAFEPANSAFLKSIKNSKVQISLPSEAMALNVFGTIIWGKEVRVEKQNNYIIGIQFEEMSPKLRGMVFAFADSICSRG
ncbi:MAG: PilZ domain-containing protein [Desulfobacterales bacterium]|jgi:hypothetical protein